MEFKNLMELSTKLLELQDQEQVKNSWYRSPKVSPHLAKLGPDCIEVRTIDTSVQIKKLEETILFIIADFKFMPYWIVQRWYDDINSIKGLASEEIKKWIRVGLVWVETSPTGVYLRPSKFLLDMFGDDIEYTNYIEIPYNTLTHTIAEAQVLFDIRIGNPNSELWQIVKDEKTMPCYHPILRDLNNIADPNEPGTLILREAQFRKGNKYKDNEQLLQAEELIRSQIRELSTNGSILGYTQEFMDFNLFPIVTYNQNQNDKKNELYTQNPDLIVPIPREHGRAKSYAIEVELTPKDAQRYNYIMQSYKNNIKFGKLFYLCGTQYIARLIKEAFQEIGGLGTCELYLIPFKAPSMDIGNFTYADEVTQFELLNESANHTINKKYET